MSTKLCLALAAFLSAAAAAFAQGESGKFFDAAPFGQPLPEGNGVMWDDPREVHEVIVDFAEAPAAGAKARVEYWGSHWPQDHLPKDREPGGGDNGWMELGNWFNGGWRVADAEEVSAPGKLGKSEKSMRFTFRPVNAHEFPDLKNYASTGRITLKIRVTGQGLPKVERIRALTDSTLVDETVRVAWRDATNATAKVEVFNGELAGRTAEGRSGMVLQLRVTTNSDPNTFDRTLVTLRGCNGAFTLRVDDLKDGALFVPAYGAAILRGDDPRDYEAVEKERREKGGKTLYDRIAEMPEQTWKAALEGMPPKKSRICFILGMDGARQKFRLDSNGGLYIRWNDQFMKGLPGKDTVRLALEKAPVQLEFGLPKEPVGRHIEEESIPTCVTTWERGGLRITQTALATALPGAREDAPPPPDECLVALARFEFSNTTATAVAAELPITFSGGEKFEALRVDERGLVWNGTQARGQVAGERDGKVTGASNQVVWRTEIPAHETKAVVVKMPFLPLVEKAEADALASLDFARERKTTADYWRGVLDKSSRLITPEPILNEFYRAVPGHLLINSEIEPGSSMRFARVGSMNYGVYGNESCMMVVDLDRRGYHQAAADCLETWLHYQGSVGLPGDFDSKEGVLYGAASYESGGYNQHHGWILWTLAEHYRFTRDDAWLRHAAPGMVAGCDWIIREVQHGESEAFLPRGLLPPGDLEDIGDWWSWLSTSCYTWRGLDAGAWALEQIHDANAPRIRAAAEAYHAALVKQFEAASERSPVVRLRDGTAVPQVPSYAQRRGRSFGWICQTLEGPIHLMITRAIDPNSREAQWILKDYEDNLFLSNQYGYTLDDFDKYWFGRGGMSMQACLLFDVEAYLYRDDVKQALRAMFNAIALNHFSDVHMNTEHALPEMGDWRGDHYKTSDEANACGWLRELFVREEGDELWIGQAAPREWLRPGQRCGLEKAETYFGPTSIIYEGAAKRITAHLRGPTRNPPKVIRVRFRTPGENQIVKLTVNGKAGEIRGDWAVLPGNIGDAEIVAEF